MRHSRGKVDPSKAWADLTLSERVIVSRTRRGWTMAELAARSGVSLETIFHLENDYHECRLSNLRALAAAFGMKCGELLD